MISNLVRPHRGLRVAVSLAVAAATLRALPAAAAPIFALADAAEIVAVGTVEAVTPYRKRSLWVFSVRPERVLKGDVATDTPLELVQEMLFETERPHFERGARTLVFAVALPSYSLYRDALPPNRYVRWAERKDTAAEIASLGDPALVEPLARYLAVRSDPEATARHLAACLAHPLPRLRSGALAAIEARPELAPLLDAAALEPLRPFFRDERVAVTERGEVLVRLARAGAAGLAPLAEEVEAESKALRAAAVDALVTLGRPPAEERLLVYAGSEEIALRIAAARGLARSGSTAALDRLAGLLANDPSPEVRVATLHALGVTPGERAVALLAEALGGSDKASVNAAAFALAHLASPGAIDRLAAALERGTPDAQAAAAFALAQTGKPQAIEVLRRLESDHADPRVRKIIKIALGESPDEHGPGDN